jgi:hypothetical protein
VIPVPTGVKVSLASGATDMRRGMNGLALQVQQVLEHDPHVGDLYVFCGRRGDLINILTDQGLTNLQDHALDLLRHRLRWNEVHPRTPRRLTDRFGVIAIIFAAFDIGLDVLRQDEMHRMARARSVPEPNNESRRRLRGR